MSKQSRIVGLLAAIALTFAMVGGAAAQSDSEMVSAELIGDPGLVCSIDIYAVGGSLGVWEWDGTQYVETSGESTVFFWGDLYDVPTNGCDVDIAFGGLLGPGGLIGPEYFSAYSYHQNASVDPAGFGDTGVFGIYDFDLTLDSVPSMVEGTYSGTVDAYVANTI